MKLVLNKIGQWFVENWRSLVSILAITVIAITTLGLRLNNLVPGQTQYETETLASINTFPVPWERAVNSPFLIPAYFVSKLINNPLLGTRIVSVIFSLIAAVCFFFVLRFWLKTRLALVGSLLFLTSSWLLNVSHQATPLAWMVLAPLLIILSLTWYLKTKKHSALAFYSLAVSLALAAYCPYAFWVIAATFIVLLVKGRHKLSTFRTKHVLIGAIIYFAMLFILFFSLAQHPGQIRELLGIPSQLPSIGQYFSNLLGVLLMLFVVSPEFPAIHLGTLPFLDAFAGVMFIFGIYYFIKHIPRRSSLIFLSSVLILIIALPINSEYIMASAILLPFVYLAIISGIAELLNDWFGFFPRNPMIRHLGVIIMSIAIGLSCYYQLHNYYIAWPNSDQTKAVYTAQITDSP